MGKIFNKGLDKDDQKDETFKRLKDIGDKNESQLEVIRDKREKQLGAIKNINTASKPLRAISYFSQLSPKAKELFEKIKNEPNDIDFTKLFCVKDNKTIFNFTVFKNSMKFASDSYRGGITLKRAEKIQRKMLKKLESLENYIPIKPEKKNYI